MYKASQPQVIVDTAVAGSQEIPFESQVGGRIYIPADSNITSITWYDASEPGGTYHASYDDNGIALVQTVAAGKSYEIPPSLSGAGALKMVGNAYDVIEVCMKKVA